MLIKFKAKRLNVIIDMGTEHREGKDKAKEIVVTSDDLSQKLVCFQVVSHIDLAYNMHSFVFRVCCD